MRRNSGRTVLSVLAALAVASSLIMLLPSRPVQSGSGCVANCSGNGICLNSSFCSCSPCFGGSACETECGGNGTCLNSSVCSCSFGFSGSQCLTECSGHGTVTNGSCVCDTGFTGSVCQTVDPCPGGCGNGTCAGNNSCFCNSGWVGKNCTVAACATDGDCDDGDPCTADSCNTATGICDHGSDVAGCLSSFRCYKSKIRSGQPKFVSPPVETQTTSFESKQTTIVKPAFLCAPVARPGSPITNPTLGLECFKSKDVSGQPKFPATNVDSATDLGTNPLAIKAPKIVCLPAILP